MDPNIKLVLDELTKLRAEMKDEFTSQEAAFSKHLDEVAVEDRICDTCVTNLEESAAALDKSFTEWRPKVDSSITAIKLELSKLNTFFDCDARATSSPSGLLPVRLATANPVANGPAGHSVDLSHRDGGFGHVFTHTHVPVTGMVHPLPLPPKSLVRLELPHGIESRVPLGKLPKINFPKFDGENPKLWQSRCEIYFDMYSVESSVWVRVATIHFEGAAARWLQSVDHRIRSVSWSEVCSWIHDRFGRDQHKSLIRQLFHIKQSASVQEYID
jgi:hypothetical protein